jgi:hypothetical protein
MKPLKDKKIKILLYACILSLAALIILFGLRFYAPTLLDIHVKWLIVAAIPILLALIIGGFITRFKGGGFELELAEARGPIIDHQEVFEILQPIGVVQKDELEVLQRMSYDEKIRTTVLRFEISRPGYYQEGAIQSYLRELPKVQFFMIVSKAGKLIAMIYINRSIFLDHGFEPVYTFINLLADGTVPHKFGPLVTGRISPDAGIADAYRRLKREFPGVLLVYMKEDDKFPKGFITLERASQYLADIVVRLIKNPT